MTAKYEILELMKQIPDDLTVEETIKRLRSAYIARDSAGREHSDKNKKDNAKQVPPENIPPPLDGRSIKERIVAIAERLQDNLTTAETISEAADDLRLFYLVQKDFEDIKEGRVPPFEEQDDEVVLDGEVAAIGAISGEQFDHMTMKEKLVHTMNRLPDNLTLGQALIEAMERLLLVYKLERSIEQIREGQTIPHDEVVSMLQERWQT